MKKRHTEIKNIRNTNLRLNMDIPIQQKAWAYLQEMDKKVFKSYSNIISHAVVEYFDKHNPKQKGELTEKDQYFLQQIQSMIQKEIKEILESNMKITEPLEKDQKQVIKPVFHEKAESISIENPEAEYEINDIALNFIEGFGNEE